MNTKKVVALVLFLSLNALASADGKPWMVVNKDKNVTCLVVAMDIKVNLTYKALDDSSKVALYHIPADASVQPDTSSCGEKEDILNVTWAVGNSFEMVYTTNGTKYDLSSFVISLNTSSLYNDSAVNQTVTVSHKHVDESYIVPSNFSYHCNREKTLNATGGFIIVSKVQFEAFKVDNTQTFSAAKDCDSHITPDIVPIAVGISLISLIVVVLVAYVVGRKRQQARGYLNIM